MCVNANFQDAIIQNKKVTREEGEFFDQPSRRVVLYAIQKTVIYKTSIEAAFCDPRLPFCLHKMSVSLQKIHFPKFRTRHLLFNKAVHQKHNSFTSKSMKTLEVLATDENLGQQ